MSAINEMSRRRFLQAGAAGVATGVVLGRQAGPAAARARGPAARTVPLNIDWRFGGPYVPGSTEPGFDDRFFARVTLPHTVTKLSWRRWDPATWEKRWIYRRHFDLPRQLAGLRVFVDFGAALTGTAATLNGTDLPEHLGGYLPFSYEITDEVSKRNNLLAVVLDSRFNLNVPPNRVAPAPTTSVDFWQPGGMYRPVSLRGVPHTYLADVFAKPVDVLGADRRVEVQCTVDADRVPEGGVRVEVELLGDGRRIAAGSAPVALSAPGRATANVTLSGLGDVELWELDAPRLYDVVTTLRIGRTAVHDHRTRIGFREARFETDGFFLNGERVQLFGLNRHQIYPFAGNAMPARVQRRDAEILRRDLNCNMVRCSHYPQSEAFLDACDELGLLVFEEAPGWGVYFGDEEWKERVRRDVREMVLRDRNHPSIVIWGARLNEAGSSAEGVALFSQTRDIAHALDDSRPTTGAMLGGGRQFPAYEQDVFSINDYRRDSSGETTLQPPRTVDAKPYLVTEAVGTLSGPARYYRRTDPVADQQGQAYAHARVHEVAWSNPRYSGLLPWSGYDYPSGAGNQFEGVKYTGVADLFRVPKPGAAIYQAQVEPAVRPVIQPAFYWDFGPQSPPNGPGPGAMICSNCDRLELFVGGEPFASVEPDRARFGHLPHPPSFVDLAVDGSSRPELRIDGYVGDDKVLSRTFSSDPSEDVLAVRVDDETLAADGTDATRVVFRALDRYGAARPYVQGDVTIAVDGPGVLVGDNPFAFEDAGGVGAVWIRTRAGAPGRIRVRVSHPTLGGGEARVLARPADGGGRPAANADLTIAATPALVERGDVARVTATLTNFDHPALRDVELALDVPAGWGTTATSPTRFASVRPGQAVEATWEARPPAGAAPGAFTVTARAGWHEGRETGGAQAATTLVVPARFEDERSNRGISDDADVTTADFDGVGNSYSAQALAAAGLPRGARVTRDGVTFTWPDVPPGTPDNVLANGQTIALSGAGSTLGFLGATSRGPITGTGTIHYEDGSSGSFRLTLDDYFNPPDANQAVAVMPYLNANNARGDGGVPGRRTHTVYVFYAGVPVEAGKPVAGVTLPRVGPNVDGGRAAMHVFAIGVG